MPESTEPNDGPANRESDWPAAFLRDADQLNLPLLMNWFGEAIDLRIANMPPVLGRPAVEEAFRQFWASLKGMNHRREEVMVEGDRAIQLSIVTYTRLDGKEVPLPVTSHLRKRAEGRLDRLWIYIDLAPLFAEGD